MTLYNFDKSEKKRFARTTKQKQLTQRIRNKEINDRLIQPFSCKTHALFAIELLSQSITFDEYSTNRLLFRANDIGNVGEWEKYQMIASLLTRYFD